MIFTKFANPIHKRYIMRKNILLILLFAFSSALSAQQTKQFTLDELIPGGKDFYNYYPRIAEQYRWRGDSLLQISGDSVFYVENPFSIQKKTFLLNQRTDKERATNFFNNEDDNRSFTAFNKENNLFIKDKEGNETAISSEENKGIVYGQSVHRDEFGINKGVFWSPSGEKLAFYRMDETMVTDYPIVDISTRIASEKSVKYPMAGETSHEVTIGIYDTKTAKTVYLKTGEPKDKFLTNVAWSPDGRWIYVAELNRGQNRMKLNRYDALSGNLDKTLFEETHPKYVEPQNPVLFVKNKPNQFVWQSNRDGYNHLYLYDVSGKLLKQLTKGNWEVTNVIGFDEKGENLFFVSTHPTPMDRHIYSVNLKNDKTTRHTSAQGMHSASLSASGRYVIDRYSSHDNPGTIDLINARNGKTVTLASARNPFAGFSIPSVETGTIKAADNKTDLHYRMIKPANFDAAKKTSRGCLRVRRPAFTNGAKPLAIRLGRLGNVYGAKRIRGFCVG